MTQQTLQCLELFFEIENLDFEVFSVFEKSIFLLKGYFTLFYTLISFAL